MFRSTLRTKVIIAIYSFNPSSIKKVEDFLDHFF